MVSVCVCGVPWMDAMLWSVREELLYNYTVQYMCNVQPWASVQYLCTHITQLRNKYIGMSADIAVCSRGHITIRERSGLLAQVSTLYEIFQTLYRMGIMSKRDWAVSHSVFSRLGKLFTNKMSQKSGKSPKGGGGVIWWGGRGFQIFRFFPWNKMK